MGILFVVVQWMSRSSRKEKSNQFRRCDSALLAANCAQEVLVSNIDNTTPQHHHGAAFLARLHFPVVFWIMEPERNV